MGEVYHAHDTMLRRAVALKIVRTEPGQGGTAGVPDPGQRARFLREARAVAGLRHPNVVTIFDVGEVDGAPYLAMELLEGRTLRAFIGQPVPLERRVRWLTEIASALDAAHRAGLVHRDVKPENVMVCKDDTVKILDFGVAKVDGPEGPHSAAHAQAAASFRTGFGAVVGTPRYMAPEQAAGLSSDPRTDEFAWGLVAFELLTGLHPRDVRPGFSKEAEWRDAAEPVERLCAGLPPPVAYVVGRALERFADARLPSMDAVVAALAPFAGPPAARGFEQTLVAPQQPPYMLPSGASTVAGPPTLGNATIPSPSGATAPPKRGPWLALGLGALALVVLGGGGAAIAYVWMNAGGDVAKVALDASPGAATATPAALVPSASPRGGASSGPGKRGGASDAGHDSGDAPKPRAAIALGMQVMLLQAGDYAVPTVEAALAPRVARVERCLNEAGADRATVREATVNFAYLPSGQVLASSVATHDGAMQACTVQDFAAGIALAPPKSGTRGGVLVTVFVR
jgi:Protein kinase domain